MIQWVDIRDYAASRNTTINVLSQVLGASGLDGVHFKDAHQSIMIHARRTDELLNPEFGSEPRGEVLRWNQTDLVEWTPGTQRVYLVTTGDFLKIGLAKDPRQRISDLQVGCPTPLVLWGLIDPVEVGADFLEFSLHQRFAQHRIRGEWFSISVLEKFNSPQDLPKAHVSD